MAIPRQEAWQQQKSVSSAETTPAFDGRDKATVEALTNASIIDLMPGQEISNFRISGATDDTVNIYDILFMADGVDHYTRVGTLSAITGTQVSPVTDQEFADQIGITNERWSSSWVEVSADDNYIGEVSIKTNGVKKIAIVPTTIVTGSTVWHRQSTL